MDGTGAFSAAAAVVQGLDMVRSTGDPAAAIQLVQQMELERPSDERYVPIYFPGTISEQAASPVDLSSGADAAGVDIPLTPVRARRVRGVVINGATGQVAQYAGLKVDQGNGPGAMAGTFPDDTAIDPNGSFDLLLFPGTHTLVGTAGTGVGFVTIEVRDADLEGIQIVAMPSFNISGRIVADGPVNSADLENIRISLLRDGGVGATSSPSYSHPRPDGSFVVEATPGDFRLNVAPILNLAARPPGPPNFQVPPSLQHAYVKSIRLGDVDVLNSGLRLQGAPAGQLEIVIGTAPRRRRRQRVRRQPDRRPGRHRGAAARCPPANRSLQDHDDRSVRPIPHRSRPARRLPRVRMAGDQRRRLAGSGLHARTGSQRDAGPRGRRKPHERPAGGDPVMLAQD